MVFIKHLHFLEIFLYSLSIYNCICVAFFMSQHNVYRNDVTSSFQCPLG